MEFKPTTSIFQGVLQPQPRPYFVLGCGMETIQFVYEKQFSRDSLKKIPVEQIFDWRHSKSGKWNCLTTCLLRSENQ